MPFIRSQTRRAVLALAIGLAAGAASAQGAYPDRPVRVIVPFAAGGTTDIFARLLGERLSQALGQQFVIENRGGAGGNIGADAVAKADPDGYTLVMGTVGTHAINASLYAKMPYDALDRFRARRLRGGRAEPDGGQPEEREGRRTSRTSSPRRRARRASSTWPPPATARRSTCRASCSSR